MKEIGELCRLRKVFFHTDAAQAIGKVPVNVNDLNIDLMSISGHKLYGPKGIGAVYVRRRPRVRLEAQISGGGQVRLRLGLVTVLKNAFLIPVLVSVIVEGEHFTHRFNSCHTLLCCELLLEHHMLPTLHATNSARLCMESALPHDSIA